MSRPAFRPSLLLMTVLLPCLLLLISHSKAEETTSGSAVLGETETDHDNGDGSSRSNDRYSDNSDVAGSKIRSRRDSHSVYPAEVPATLI